MVIKQSGEKRHVYPVTLCMERSSISKIAISGVYGGEDGDRSEKRNYVWWGSGIGIGRMMIEE